MDRVQIYNIILSWYESIYLHYLKKKKRIREYSVKLMEYTNGRSNLHINNR